MEATLLASAAVKGETNRLPARTAVAPSPGANAPSVKLPLTFMLIGLLALCVGSGWLVARPAILATYHYNQYVIAITHLFVLGWICSVVMGAMYQLVPVALETKLYSERLARWQLAFHVVGFTGMVWMFWTWNMKQVGHFGCALAVGIGLFAYNLARTLRRVPKWNVTAWAVAAALVWISLTATAGLCIAAAKATYQTMYESSAPVAGVLSVLQAIARFMSRFDALSTMHAHAHLGVVGFFTMLIVGVSYKLIPMFTLSEVQNRRRAGWSVALLNVGLAGSFLTILLRSRWKPAFALIVAAALALYGLELVAILRARKRKALDWGVKYFLTAVALLLPVSLLGVVLSWPTLPSNPFTGQLENVYGFLGLIGVVTFAIIGMLYKIIPFLVWFACYSRQIGRTRVPALAEMYSARCQAFGYWTYLAGLGVTCVAIVFSHELGVSWGCGLLALSVAALALNVGRILTHLFRPELKPLAFPSSTVPRSA